MKYPKVRAYWAGLIFGILFSANSFALDHYICPAIDYDAKYETIAPGLQFARERISYWNNQILAAKNLFKHENDELKADKNDYKKNKISDEALQIQGFKVECENRRIDYLSGEVLSANMSYSYMKKHPDYIPFKDEPKAPAAATASSSNATTAPKGTP